MDDTKPVKFDPDKVAKMIKSATPLPMPIGRNDACVCGSGMKFKRCCGRHTTPPKPGARFDEMDGQQRRELQNGIAAIVEANLPPGESRNGRALFTLVIWDRRYSGYVSNGERYGQAAALKVAAQKMAEQLDDGVREYTSGVVPMARDRDALAKLYYACHSLANATNESREEMQINYDEALAEAGKIVNEDGY